MKKLIIIISILLAVSNSAIAQKIHFCDTTNQWVTISYDPYFHTYGHSFYQYFDYGGLFSWGSYFYQDLHLTIYNPSLYYGGGGGWTNGDFFVREDTVANIVYYLDVADSTGYDKILYDFNVHPGDTFRRHFPYIANWLTDSVISVDSVLIGSYYYKKFTVKEIDTFYQRIVGVDTSGWDTVYTYMEGIGSLFSPVSNQNNSESLGFQDYLECFMNNGVSPVVDSISYFYPSRADTLYFVNNCAAVGVHNVPKDQCTNVRIYPNPANNYITVESIANCEIKILDIVGREKITMKSEKADAVVNLNGLAKGIYFAEITNIETGIKVVKKIVKE